MKIQLSPSQILWTLSESPNAHLESEISFKTKVPLISHPTSQMHHPKFNVQQAKNSNANIDYKKIIHHEENNNIINPKFQMGLGPNYPGPNCPPWKSGKLGPGQLGPGARLSVLKKWQIGPRTVGPWKCTIPKTTKSLKNKTQNPKCKQWCSQI